MNRRRFLISSLGVGTLAVGGGPSLASAGAATDDELAFLNFGASTELLVKDYYTKALEATLLPKAGLAAAKRGRAAAGQHARALSDALVGAGDVAPVERTSSSSGGAEPFPVAMDLEAASDALEAYLG